LILGTGIVGLHHLLRNVYADTMRRVGGQCLAIGDQVRTRSMDTRGGTHSGHQTRATCIVQESHWVDGCFLVLILVVISPVDSNEVDPGLDGLCKLPQALFMLDVVFRGLVTFSMSAQDHARGSEIGSRLGYSYGQVG
jgi:hypothetical protein